MPRPVLAVVVAIVTALVVFALWPEGESPIPPHKAANAEEAAALAGSKGLAWREGDTVNLRMKSGEVLALTDRVSCGDLPCPKEFLTRYRYLGWDAVNGGYRLLVTPGAEAGEESEMVLPFAEDPVLIDARHPEPPGTGPLPQPTPPPAAGNDEGLTEWLGEIASGRSQSEAARILQSKGKAKRDGMRLTLTLAAGRKLTLTDDLACGQLACPPQVFRSFTYQGASPDSKYHVVEQSSDEMTTAIFVADSDGAITDLVGLPKFSPDGTHAIAAVADLEWSAPRRLEVWLLSGASPSVAFSVAADDEDDTVYEVVGWSDNDHVRLRRGPWGDQTRNEVMLVRDKGGWHLESGEAGD